MKTKVKPVSWAAEDVLLFGDRMRLQIIVLLVGLGVLQFGGEFSGVSARVEVIGVFAGLLLAPVFTCARREHERYTKTMEQSTKITRAAQQSLPLCPLLTSLSCS